MAKITGAAPVPRVKKAHFLTVTDVRISSLSHPGASKWEVNLTKNIGHNMKNITPTSTNKQTSAMKHGTC